MLLLRLRLVPLAEPGEERERALRPAPPVRCVVCISRSPLVPLLALAYDKLPGVTSPAKLGT
eukprot:9052752-Pyramimonas_sp.AAC.1